ncbi:MAG: ABC transporter permease [Crocinitomicaceae bacterium]|nr:MAG: ABC transporter permease [Crocinitomicaceae bacterium]
MLVNLITVAVVTGFQKEVRDKVIGFGAHAVVTKSGEASVFESEPILKNQFFYPVLERSAQVRHIQPVAYKPALLQSDANTDVQQQIQGIMVKGVDENYDWTFFKKNLVEGRLPKIDGKKVTDEILISAKIANDLNYKVGDQARTFFVKNKPIKKMFTIVGIFETGLEDFDREIVIADIQHIQKLNDWGIQASIHVSDTLASNGHLILKADVIGGNGNYRYDWGRGYENYRGISFFPTTDTVVRLVVSDYWMFIDGSDHPTVIPDTAYIRVQVSGDKTSLFPYDVDADRKVKKKFLDESGYRYSVSAGPKKITFEQLDGKGSFSNYVGAFEFTLRDWNSLQEDVKFVKKQIQFKDPSGEDLRVTSIVDSESDIFVWLGFLDINVYIILVLMIVIGVINMGSALLVMILVKTNFIGMMKAIGATNWSIRKVFLYQAGFLVLRGMFWGNVIGIGLCMIQKYGQVMRLNPEVYYLNAVPIDLSIVAVLVLNAATLLVCMLALIIPSYVITRISPVKAIRFN